MNQLPSMGIESFVECAALRISRRGFVFGWAGLPLLAQEQERVEARNVSYPFAEIEGRITPTDSFFVRSHFAKPRLSLRTWSLSVEGRVENPRQLGIADLIESPAKKMEALLECAGNSAGGFAASNGEWEGISLAHLLQETGVHPSATGVLLEGTDSGPLVSGAPHLPYRRVVPIQKCLSPESLLAFKLNGRLLPENNGFPLRAVLPGWYAMDSVKWLRRVVVLGPDNPADFEQESGMDRLYHRMLPAGGDRITATRLTEIQVKSVIASPSASPGTEATLPAGKHRVWGFAWTGASLVRQVDLSTDGGRTWQPANLDATAKPFTWVKWSYSWDARPGDHSLMSRASDERGNRQPAERDPLRRDGYELNWCAPVRCTVI